MTRVIIILVLIFLLLSIIRNILRRYKKNSVSIKNTSGAPNIDKPKKKSDADIIVDAKFEELK